MKKYEEGTVFQLYKNEDSDYIVLKSVEYKECEYIVAAPFKEKNIVLD